MRADHVGKLPEVLQQAVLIGNIGLNVPSVWGDGDIPILAVVPQKIHVGKHRRRILSTEADDVHHRRIEAVSADLTRVKRIAHADDSFTESVRKPLCVECRYVCSLTGVDDHSAPLAFLAKIHTHYFAMIITGKRPFEKTIVGGSKGGGRRPCDRNNLKNRIWLL